MSNTKNDGVDEKVKDEDIQSLPLIKKLAAIRKLADATKKSKQGYGYKYSDIAAILAKVTGGMNRYGVSLIPELVHGTFSCTQNVIHKTKPAKDGRVYEDVNTEMLVVSDMNFKWVNDDDPSDCIVIPWNLVGAQSDPAQALGTALTYSMRQFLINYFQIAQVDKEIEQYRKEQKEAEDRESLAVAKAIVGKILSMAQTYTDANPDKRNELIKFFKKYERSGNPEKIKDPNVAREVLMAMQEKFFKEDKKDGDDAKKEEKKEGK